MDIRIDRLLYFFILYIQVLHIFGVGLDEGLAGRHLVPHEGVEDLIGLHRILDLNL